MSSDTRPSELSDRSPSPPTCIGATTDIEPPAATCRATGPAADALAVASRRDDDALSDTAAQLGMAPWRQIVESLRFGVLIVDEDWRAIEVNPAANATLGADRALAVEQGRVVFRPQKAQERAASWLRGASDGRASPLAIERATGGSPFLIDHLHRFAGAAGEATHVLIVLDPGQPPCVDADRLATAFGLTRAEARLMAALAAGQTLQTFAQRHEVGVATARTHLESICAKTGAKRQAQVVRLALACAAPVAGHRDGDQPALRPRDGRSSGHRVPGSTGAPIASCECRSRST